MEYDPTSPPATKKADFEKYFDIERQSMPLEGYADREDANLRRQRAMFLLDIVAKKESDVFIPYLALSYFDRFLSRKSLALQHVQLAVVCCIFLAAKMRDNTFSVHLFLNNWPYLIFDPDYIVDMEAYILDAIEWRLQSVTALCFVVYFLQVLPDNLRPPRSVVNEIIIQTQSEIRLTQFRPSVIAATATFTASSVQFPLKFLECFNFFVSCNHLNMDDFNRCLEIMMGSCKRKRFLKATSVVKQGSRSSGVEASERGPVESSEARDVPQRRPGKEPVGESSRTVEAPVESLWETIDFIMGGLRMEPAREISEVPEGMQSSWENLMDEARRWSARSPIQRVPVKSEITEEPERGNVNVLNFELKWLTQEEEKLAREYIHNLRLAASSSYNVSSHVAEVHNTEDINRPDADIARGARAEREGTDRQSAGSYRGARSEPIDFAVYSAASDRRERAEREGAYRQSAGSDRRARTERINFGAYSAASDRGARAVRSDAVLREVFGDRGATTERHDADRHSTEGDRGATAERHDADRHSAEGDRGTTAERHDAADRHSTEGDRGTTAERHDTDRHSTEGERGATAEPDNTTLHRCCKLQ